jgi:hypothetical protein
VFIGAIFHITSIVVTVVQWIVVTVGRIRTGNALVAIDNERKRGHVDLVAILRRIRNGGASGIDVSKGRKKLRGTSGIDVSIGDGRRKLRGTSGIDVSIGDGRRKLRGRVASRRWDGRKQRGDRGRCRL